WNEIISTHSKNKLTKIDFLKKTERHLADDLGEIGIVYFNQGNYVKGLEYYFKALSIDERLGNKSGVAANFSNMGSLFAHTGEINKALDYYLRALKINEELGDKLGMNTTLENIGVIYFEQAD